MKVSKKFMICCVTGHRPSGFPFERDENSAAYTAYLSKLHSEVGFLIRDGYDKFITGMAEGADLDFAKCVLDYRNMGRNVTLEAALPYPPKSANHRTAYTKERDDILKQCDKPTIVSPTYHKGCMHMRNRYMVDKADTVLAVWNGNENGGTWSTVQYARAKNKPVRYILLSEL